LEFLADEEEAFGTFWWYDILKEEKEQERRCPKCGSQIMHYDDVREVWVCLDCDFKWRKKWHRSLSKIGRGARWSGGKVTKTYIIRFLIEGRCGKFD